MMLSATYLITRKLQKGPQLIGRFLVSSIIVIEKPINSIALGFGFS